MRRRRYSWSGSRRSGPVDDLTKQWLAQERDKANQRKVKELAGKNTEEAIRARLELSPKFRKADGTIDHKKIDWFIEQLKKDGKIDKNNPASCAMTPAKLARINRAKYGTDRAIQMMRRHMKYADPYDRAYYEAVIEELCPRARKNPEGPKTRKRAKPSWLRYSHAKKVVYHTTTADEDFSSFDTTRSDLGAHFGTIDQAEFRADLLGMYDDQSTASNVRIIPAWINVRYPLRLKDVGSFHADAIAGQLARKKIISKDLAKEIEQAYNRSYKSRKIYDPIVRQAIEDAGYDGVVYKNTTEGIGDSYIVFHPQQVKSVYGNTGVFNEHDPDMRNPGVLRARPGFWKELGVKREGLKKVQKELWETKGIWKTIEELEQFVLAHQTKLLQGMIRVVK